MPDCKHSSDQKIDFVSDSLGYKRLLLLNLFRLLTILF
jgi:hypothetical protein